MSIAPYRTRTERSDAEVRAALAGCPLGARLFHVHAQVTRELARDLAFVWDGFAERLERVAVVSAIERGTLSPRDYLCFLRNLHRHVADSSRWLAAATANMGPAFGLASATLYAMAGEAQRDLVVLRRNYAAAGGSVEELVQAQGNVGAEALSAFMFYRATQPDPLDLFGALFVFQSVGIARAGRWAERIRARLGLSEAAVSYLAYDSRLDDEHHERMRNVLAAPFVDAGVAARIVRSARTTARLYLLQLEELDHV